MKEKWLKKTKKDKKILVWVGQWIGWWKPAFFKNPKELLNKVNEYFNWWYNKKMAITPLWVQIEIPQITVTDLAIFLWFESRQSFYDYEKHEKFAYIIKRARLFIEREYEERLTSQSPTGAIFALKNMWWKDKTETDITSGWKEIITIWLPQIDK